MCRATVPGAVQHALRLAGWLPDWNLRLNARTRKWVVHRQWMYEVVRTALQRLGVRWKRAKQLRAFAVRLFYCSNALGLQV